MQEGKTEIPDWLLEMSQQMSTQPTRCTSDPFWQVRCKRFIVAAEGYQDHHWELVDEGESFYRDDKDDRQVIADYLEEYHKDWFYATIADYYSVQEFLDVFDFTDNYNLPAEVVCVHLQEIEEVVTTHLTETDAEWFIQRKQHDYPKLYTYVASAYWSPQLKQLMGWIKDLT